MCLGKNILTANNALRYVQLQQSEVLGQNLKTPAACQEILLK